MSKRTILAVAAAACLVGVAVTPSANATSDDGVKYQGLRLDVPNSWRVVDLGERPDACVRFDIPTVYLGSPGDQTSCPAGISGRSAGIVVEPAEDATVRPPSAGTEQFSVRQADVLLTTAYTPATRSAVRDVVDSARLASGEPATPQRAKPVTADQNEQGIITPGDYTGEGFDACSAPSQEAMDAWLESPYRAVGIYISGIQRACDQPNITPEWISTQFENGWRFFPLHVGLQAPCSDRENKMSDDPATARAQGVEAATESADAAAALGIEQGSALYNDMEAYPNDGGVCTTAVLSFLAGWTDELHNRGYLSGVYSSAASGVADLVGAYNDDTYTNPDHIFFAWWNDQADTDGGDYIPDDYWANRQRIHQYVGEVDETYGGVTINIDRDYLDVAPAAR